jgi:hypothetical protein
MKNEKKEAMELVGKFIKHSYHNNNYLECHEHAKECAIISVQEKIKYAKTFGDVTELDIKHFEDFIKVIKSL